MITSPVYNRIIGVSRTVPSSEPVLLPEMKRYLNMAFDTPASYTFTDDDTLIGELIQAARQTIENYCGVTIAFSTVTVVIDNSAGNMEIPYGPIEIEGITSVKNRDGDLLTINDDYTIEGFGWKRLLTPFSDYVEITFPGGYSSVPFQLKQGIKQLVAYWYKNRGEVGQMNTEALKTVAPYKRHSWLM